MSDAFYKAFPLPGRGTGAFCRVMRSGPDLTLRIQGGRHTAACTVWVLLVGALTQVGQTDATGQLSVRVAGRLEDLVAVYLTQNDAVVAKSPGAPFFAAVAPKRAPRREVPPVDVEPPVAIQPAQQEILPEEGGGPVSPAPEDCQACADDFEDDVCPSCERLPEDEGAPAAPVPEDCHADADEVEDDVCTACPDEQEGAILEPLTCTETPPQGDEPAEVEAMPEDTEPCVDEQEEPSNDAWQALARMADVLAPPEDDEFDEQDNQVWEAMARAVAFTEPVTQADSAPEGAMPEEAAAPGDDDVPCDEDDGGIDNPISTPPNDMPCDEDEEDLLRPFAPDQSSADVACHPVMGAGDEPMLVCEDNDEEYELPMP